MILIGIQHACVVGLVMLSIVPPFADVCLQLITYKLEFILYFLKRSFNLLVCLGGHIAVLYPSRSLEPFASHDKLSIPIIRFGHACNLVQFADIYAHSVTLVAYLPAHDDGKWRQEHCLSLILFCRTQRPLPRSR